MAKGAFVDDPSAILDSIVDCVVVVDHDFLIKGINSAAEVFFGIPANALLGQSALELVVDGDRVETTVRFRELLEGRDVPPVVFRIMRNTGKPRWVEATGRRLSVPIVNSHFEAPVKTPLESQVVISLRSVGSRLKRELEGLQAVRRAHLISQIAAALQTTDPSTFNGVLLNALTEVGSLLGTHLISAYEVDSSGRTFTLRSRWENELLVQSAKPAPQTRIEVEDIPNVVKALTGPSRLSFFAPDSRLGIELQAVDASVLGGVLVPLMTSSDHVGMLIMNWAQEHEVLNEEEQFILGLAEVVSVALSRITTNQALIAQNSLLERIFERTRVPMLIVSRVDLKVTRANKAAAELYTRDLRNLDGMPISEISSELGMQLADFSVQAHSQENRDLRIVIRTDRNGEEIELELSIDTMTMMELPCYLIVVRNILPIN